MSRNSTMDLTTGHPLKQLQTQPCGQTFYGLLFFIYRLSLFSTGQSLICYTGTIIQRRRIHHETQQYPSAVQRPCHADFFFLSLASLALGHLTNGWTTYHLFSVYRSSLADPLFFVRLFGHVLGHAGWDHFIGNMLLFLVIAPPLEERYGSRTLLSGILMTALVSGILQCVLFPSSALLGASGIVFMLIMLSSLAGSRNGGVPITLILVGALYLSQQVYDILFVQDNVANFMHIVGGVCGTGFGFAVRRK